MDDNMDDNMLLTANSKGEYPADQSQGPEGGRLRSFLFSWKRHTPDKMAIS